MTENHYVVILTSLAKIVVMTFDDLDRKLRVFETAHDRAVLPETYIVARIDGRSFTRLTKETVGFEAPFDIRFREDERD